MTTDFNIPDKGNLVGAFNWEDDKYTVTVTEPYLYEKTLDDLLIRGHTVYTADNPENLDIPPYPDTTVTTNYYLLRRWRKLIAGLSLVSGKSASGVYRLCTLHGYSIFVHNLGSEALKSFEGITPKIFDNDPDTMEALERVNCNIKLHNIDGNREDGGRSAFRLSEQESARIGIIATVICMPKDKLVTLLICYSLLTHPRLLKWYPDMQENIKQFETRQEFRKDNMDGI